MHADTLPMLFQRQADRYGSRVALRYKKDGLYRDLRWDEYRDQVASCAAGLILHGIQKGDRVAILAENRHEWLIADMAILSIGAVNVPLHAPLSAQQVGWQLADAGARFVFASTQGQREKILPLTPNPSPPEGRGENVLSVIVFDDTSWQGLLQRGRCASDAVKQELARRIAGVKLDDLATIIYTSGTTGNPKGVMLTHGNLHSNAVAFTQVSKFTDASMFFNWLPFSHIYARTIDIYVTLAVGATLSLAESADTVVANIMEVQPTNLSAVPRFYEKVLTAVQDADPAIVKKKLLAVFGPRIDFLGSGGAPLPLAVAQAYKDAGMLVLQGYGLTESSPVISFNRTDAYKIESVGRPIPGVEVRIGGDGEVLTRGPHVMKGYWNNPRATAEAIVDGWLHTGDLGRLDDDGFLHITGRKKELLVLSNGKKVVPSHIEGLLLADPCIDQVVVYGEGRNYLTALVVPHWANLTQAMKPTGTTPPHPQPLSPEEARGECGTPPHPQPLSPEGARGECGTPPHPQPLSPEGARGECGTPPHPQPLSPEGARGVEPGDSTVRSFLEARIQQALTAVAAWEQVRKVVILPEPLSVANDELTVSLKLRRTVIFQKHASALESLYRE